MTIEARDHTGKERPISSRRLQAIELAETARRAETTFEKATNVTIKKIDQVIISKSLFEDYSPWNLAPKTHYSPFSNILKS